MIVPDKLGLRIGYAPICARRFISYSAMLTAELIQRRIQISEEQPILQCLTGTRMHICVSGTE